MLVSNPGPVLLKIWKTFGRLPGGRLVFRLLLKVVVPYTSTISPNVLELKPGFARISMKDRRRVRNHLQSVHAIALANLAEATSGMAVITALPENFRGILKEFHVTYLKKARGTLVSECTVPTLSLTNQTTTLVNVSIQDQAGDVVTTAVAHWLLGPKK